MSTQFYTQDQPTTSQPDTGHRAPRPQGDGPSWFRIWTIVIGTVVAAALIVLAAVGLTRNHTTQAPAPAASAATSQSARPGPADHPGPADDPGPADHPGRRPVGVGQDAAAGTRPAELLRGPGRRHHGTADRRGHQGPPAPGQPAPDRHHERRYPGRPGQLPGPRQQPDGRLTAPAQASDQEAGTQSRPSAVPPCGGTALSFILGTATMTCCPPGLVTVNGTAMLGGAKATFFRPGRRHCAGGSGRVS